MTILGQAILDLKVRELAFSKWLRAKGIVEVDLPTHELIKLLNQFERERK